MSLPAKRSFDEDLGDDAPVAGAGGPVASTGVSADTTDPRVLALVRVFERRSMCRRVGEEELAGDMRLVISFL